MLKRKEKHSSKPAKTAHHRTPEKKAKSVEQSTKVEHPLVAKPKPEPMTEVEASRKVATMSAPLPTEPAPAPAPAPHREPDVNTGTTRSAHN